VDRATLLSVGFSSVTGGFSDRAARQTQKIIAEKSF
jgi:hypothetical protein